MNWRRIAIIAEDTDYGIGFVNALPEVKDELGLDLEFNSWVFARGTTDFTPILLEVNDWNPDVIIDIGVGADALRLAEQAYDQGLFPRIPMIASFAWPTYPDFWPTLGEKGKYILYTAYYHPYMNLTDQGKWFLHEYMAKYGEYPHFYQQCFFDAIVIFAKAMGYADSTNPDDIIKAMDTNEFETYFGTIHFEKNPGTPYYNHVPVSHIMCQFTSTEQTHVDATIVFPPEFATGQYTPPP